MCLSKFLNRKPHIFLFKNFDRHILVNELFKSGNFGNDKF